MRNNLRRIIMIGGTAALISLGGSLALAQDAPVAPAGDQAAGERSDRGDREGRRGGRGQWGNMDPAQRQEMMLQGIKAQVGATDEEWEAMKPKVQEIVKLRATEQAATMRAMFRGMGRFGGRDQNAGGDQARRDGNRGNRMGGMFGGQEMPELDALADAAESDSATNEDLKAKMKAYREAVKRNADDLKAAREELRQLLTVKQEARLVSMGLLD